MKLPFHRSCKDLADALGDHLLQGLLDKSPTKNHDEPFKNTSFFSLALRYHMDDGIEWAEQLKSAPQRHEWHLITMYIGGESTTHVAKSQKVAIAYVVEQLDQFAEFISQIETGRRSVRFCRQDKILAVVEPLPITYPAIEPINRVARCLDRAHTNCTSQELRQRFKSIRGLETIKSDEFQIGSPRPYTLSTLSLANQMTTFLSQISSKAFARSEVLEITARFFGFQSWNLFTGAEKKHQVHKTFDHPYQISWGAESGDIYILGVSAALAYFADIVSTSKQPKEVFIRRYLGFCATASYDNSQKLNMNLMDVVTVDNLADKLADLVDAGSVLDKLGGSTTGKFRLTHRAKRRGVDNEYALIGSWLVYIEPDHSGYHRLVLERYNPELTDCLERIVTRQYKSSLQFGKDGETWLATDWDHKPVHKLTGLELTEAFQLEMAFINRENWRLNAVA